MPSGDFSRPTGGRKKVRRKKPPTKAPVTDVQSSGSDYGKPKAKAYKKTPEYKKTIRVIKKREAAKRAAGVGRTLGPVEVQLKTSGLGGALDSAAGKLASVTGDALKIPGPALALLTAGGSEIIGDKGKKVTRNALHDLFNIPVQTIPSAYHLGEQALGGHPGVAAKMLVQPYKDLVKDPGKAFEDHPVGTSLLVAGPARGLTRTSGTVLRRIPATKKLASTSRESRTLPGTSLVEVRSYSKDPVVKAAQVVRERRRVRKAQQLREKADRVEQQSVTRAYELREKAARTDPTRIKPRAIRRRVDERVAATEDVRRANRSEVMDATQEILRPARDGGAALNLIAQNITTASKADLRAYVKQLEVEYAKLGEAGKQANKKLRQEIQKVLESKSYDPGVVEVAARKYAEYVRPLQDALVKRGLLDKEQADKARLMPYAVRRMDARHDGNRLVDADGQPITAAQIRAHMRKNNVSEPAFISQAPNARGAKNFYRSSAEPTDLGRSRRTGEATRRGTFDADPETLVEAAARSQGLKDATDGFRNFIGEFAATEGGRVRTFRTYREAAEAVRDMNAKGGGVPMRPVRVNPWAGSKEQLQRLLDDIDSESAQVHEALVDSIEKAVKGEDGPGPWALIPEAAADQMRQHMRTLGATSAGKIGQMVNSAFRQTVLSMSPKWLTGNTIEAALRTSVAGAGPRSYVTGRKVLKRAEQLNRDKALEARSRTVGGGHFSMATRQHIRRDASQFQGSSFEGMARTLGAFWRAPGPRHISRLWQGWTEFVFKTLNGRLESQFQTTMLGKLLRESPLMDGHMLKMSSKAIDQAARGLLKTEEQVAFGRAIDRMYGRYSKYSPNERRAIALYTPFVAWSLNAVRFVYDVLPRDHPVVTSLIVASEKATEEWRKEHGLDRYIEGALPGFLQGSIPTKNGGHLRVSRYTPFGAFGDLGETVAGNVLPQYSGPLLALQGRDWLGREIRRNGKPVEEPEKEFIALFEFMKATIPVLGQAVNIAKGEGPLVDRLRKQYDPFTAVSPKKGKADSAASVGVSDREIELLRREQETSSTAPAVSEREIQMLLREQGGS